jgi:Ca-activated chloride channel family protein
MRASLLLFFLVCLLAASYLLPTSAQAPEATANPLACESSNQRQISLNVTDKEGAFIDALRPEDLSLTVNDTPAEILNLDKKLDQSLAVVILIDTSMSQAGTLDETKLAASKFVEWVLHSKKDRAAVVSFSGEAVVEADLTNDSPVLLAAIKRVKLDRPPDYQLGGVTTGRTPPMRPRRQGTTAMWDAVWASTDEILQPVTDSRRVILLLTEGADSSSSSRWRETIKHAAVSDVAVFSIGVSGQTYFDIVGERNLEDLSEATGGRPFFPKKVQDLPGIFVKIEQGLRSSYLISYCAAKPGSPDTPLKIHIEAKTPQLRETHPRLLYRRYST